jgi:hypothetical protein
MVAAAPANCMNVRRGSFMVHPIATPKLSQFPILKKGSGLAPRAAVASFLRGVGLPDNLIEYLGPRGPRR